jgi:hypothetical protein
VFGWTDVNAELLESVIEDAAAIVISLPPKDAALSDEDLNRWLAVETMLANSTVACPLYFVESVDAWDEVVNGVKRGGFDGTLTLAVDSPAPKRLEAISATNFQTFFSGSDGKHTIAIIAHYDSSAAAPTLARGATSNGSGMVLLFALLRLFRSLYDDETTRPSANLMFVLTAGGHNNYAGTRHWLLNRCTTPVFSGAFFFMRNCNNIAVTAACLTPLILSCASTQLALQMPSIFTSADL